MEPVFDLATVDKLLTTTRSVRRRLDFTRPVPSAVIQECLEIAIQAPTGGNQPWYHFMVVTDPAKRAGMADLYRQAFYARYTPEYRAELQQTDPRALDSFVHLADHLHDVPVLVIPCVETKFTPASLYGCILPAAWSLMLALRARGLGAAWTSIHIARYEKEAAALLGIPDHVTQAALLPVAYYTGTDFQPAKRLPARERTYWDT